MNPAPPVTRSKPGASGKADSTVPVSAALLPQGGINNFRPVYDAPGESVTLLRSLPELPQNFVHDSARHSLHPLHPQTVAKPPREPNDPIEIAKPESGIVARGEACGHSTMFSEKTRSWW